MVASLFQTIQTPGSGLRPVNIRTDMATIADLLELCFEDMDNSGRAAIRDMRSMASSGTFLWIMQNVDRMLKALMQGYVWVEDGAIVGNVSLYPAGYERTWVLANVAVHPDYRRQGIGYELCEAALERLRSWRGRTAILQVESHNETAQNLYKRLGFTAERTFTRWQRSNTGHPPTETIHIPELTYRNMHEGRAAYTLANRLRPNSQGGLGWLRPMRKSTFDPGLLRRLGRLFNPGSGEQWVMRGENQRLEALLLTETYFGSSTTRFDMMVHPDKQGILEEALVNYLVRHAAGRNRGLMTEHPADDEFAAEVFRAYHFTVKRTQIHMRRPLR